MTISKTLPSGPTGPSLTRRSFFKGVAAVAVVANLPVLPARVASAFSLPCNEHLIRSNLWSAQLKEMLLNDLMDMKFVSITEDTDGSA